MLIVEGDETVRSLTILEKESHLIITYEQHFVQGELPQKKKPLAELGSGRSSHLPQQAG